MIISTTEINTHKTTDGVKVNKSNVVWQIRENFIEEGTFWLSLKGEKFSWGCLGREGCSWKENNSLKSMEASGASENGRVKIFKNSLLQKNNVVQNQLFQESVN